MNLLTIRANSIVSVLENEHDFCHTMGNLNRWLFAKSATKVILFDDKIRIDSRTFKLPKKAIKNCGTLVEYIQEQIQKRLQS